MVIQSGDKSQLDAVAEMLMEKFEEQNKKNKKVIEILKQIKEDISGLLEAQDFTIAEDNNDPMLLP
ncbi:hypothetical protein [Wolbachia endosymbiont of Wuchereria bancrofti]|uniref:hypothetical protein n=1 Tax=Wolbachia endosymbiont of Wuchereria bancrofti TaxID=96496 RepID=UPI000B4CBA67|nr:hypothetical protein [Wolbachia endosymbiont of Wuchereria bancrofti]OWZ25015.1 hypothetical protein CCY16_00933 [Wolbachia endosymbiont of Wuchereria bancrofti]